MLEKADAPMGVVFGDIEFYEVPSGYEFFKSHCITGGIDIASDNPDEKHILTIDIPTLKIMDLAGVEIKGLGASIDGMDGDAFQVTISGIPYPFYAKEFQHHIQAYEDLLKREQ